MGKKWWNRKEVKKKKNYISTETEANYPINWVKILMCVCLSIMNIAHVAVAVCPVAHQTLKND